MRYRDEYPPDIARARKAIGLAMKVHRTLGCGFVESIYRGAMAIELRNADMEFETHPVLPVFYEGEEIGVFQANMIVEGKLIVELMAVEALTIPHSLQLVNYLHAAQIDHGLLLNFGTKSLQFKSKFRNFPERNEDEIRPPSDFHS